MSTAQSALAAEFYVVGGTMRPTAPSYIERKADGELFDGLMRGEFCYVLTARQMGKSSLMIRTVGKLRDAGIGVAVLDLTAIGQNLTVEQWYAGLILQLGLRLDLPTLEDELIEFWQTQSLLGPLQRWLAAIRTVVLPRYDGKLVIFIDEIDSVLSLPFPTDEFFAGIRECYNSRSENPEFERLTFCLLGVASPADLIRDTRTTPFNIGHRIELRDFSEQEAAPLARGFGGEGQTGVWMLKRILYWSGGHPYLTQRLCRAIAETPNAKGTAVMDHLCEELFFTRRARELDDNLLFVRERILRSEADLASLLDLYGKVRKGRRVRDDESNPRVSILLLSGITRSEGGRLRVRNRIYKQVFDQTWVTSNMPDAELRRQRAAFWRGAFQIAIVGVVILMIVGWLAFTAVREAESRRRLLYLSQIELAWQEWETNSNTDRVNELLGNSLPQAGDDDLRSCEWYQLWHLVHQELKSVRLKNEIVAAAFSQDAGTLTVVEAQRTRATYAVINCDARTLDWTPLFSIPSGQNFDAIALSPDRKLVAADSPENKLTLWELSSGRKLREFGARDSPISLITFSPDGQLVAGGYLQGTIILVDVKTAGFKLINSQDSRQISSISFSPDNRVIAIADESANVRMWDIKTEQELPPLQTGETGIARVSFFPDGKQVLTAGVDGTLHLWELSTRTSLVTMSGHDRHVKSVSLSPDGQTLATSSLDRTVRLWSVKKGKEIETIKGHGANVATLSWSPDSNYLATGGADGSLKIWNTRKPALGDRIESFQATAFTPSGEPVVFGVTVEGIGRLWNYATGQVLATLHDGSQQTPSIFNAANGKILCAVFSPDGQSLATAGTDKQIKIWDRMTGRLLKTLSAHTEFVYGFDFSPDSQFLISGGKDKRLLLWDIRTEGVIGQLSGGDNVENAYRAVFSPDGKLMAAALRDGRVMLCDVATRKVLRFFEGHTRMVTSIKFSPNGKLLATGGEDNTLRLWDVSSGRGIRSMGQSQVQRMAFSPDGKRLVAGGMDGTVKLWDVATSQEIFTFRGHSQQVTSVTFAPDGRSLITSGTEGTIRYWRAATEKEVLEQGQGVRR